MIPAALLLFEDVEKLAMLFFGVCKLLIVSAVDVAVLDEVMLSCVVIKSKELSLLVGDELTSSTSRLFEEGEEGVVQETSLSFLLLLLLLLPMLLPLITPCRRVTLLFR